MYQDIFLFYDPVINIVCALFEALLYVIIYEYLCYTYIYVQ